MNGNLRNAGRVNDQEEDLLDLRRLVGQIGERIWVLIICLLVFVAAAFAYLKNAKPIFEATAMIEVPQQARRVVEMQLQDGYDLGGDEALQTIESSLQRTSLVQRVAAREDVREYLTVSDPLLRDSAGSVALALAIKERTNIELLKGTRLIAISVQDSVPALAKNLANGLVDEFIKEKAEERSGTSQSDFAFLLKEAERLGKKLKGSEALLQDFLPYEEALVINESFRDEMENISVLLQRYGESHPLVSQSRGQISGLLNQLESNLDAVIEKNDGGSDEVPDFKNDGTVEVRKKQVDEVIRILAARYQAAKRDVEIDRELHETIVSRMEEATVTKDLDTSVLKFSEPAFLPITPIKPKAIQVLGAATVFGLGAGLFIIWLMIMVSSGLSTVDEVEAKLQLPVIGAIPEDRRIVDSNNVRASDHERLVQLKHTYSEAGSEGLKKLNATVSMNSRILPLVLLSAPGCAVAESFRGLRAALTMLAKESQGEAGERQTLTTLVTSALPGEGKTLVASNLAVAFAAQDGLRTLLVDLDLRLPAVDRFFRPETTATGGSVSLLRNSETGFTSAITKSGIKGLDLLLPGEMTSNPAEILTTRGVDRLLAEVCSKYDRIVIDSAPVNPVADTLLLASGALDSAILVTRANKTPSNAVLKARNLMQNAGFPLAGIVLNRLPKKSGILANPFFYYYQQSGSSYGENYGTSY